LPFSILVSLPFEDNGLALSNGPLLLGGLYVLGVEATFLLPEGNYSPSGIVLYPLEDVKGKNLSRARLYWIIDATLAAYLAAGTAAMTRKQLQQLAKSELIEIILRRQALIE